LKISLPEITSLIRNRWIEMVEKLTSPLRYDSAEDVKMRLDGTYLMYKGEIVRCNWYNNLKIYVTGIAANSSIPPETIIHSSNIDLDVSSLPLGYLVYEGNAWPTIARRAPLRKYKQGICSQNVFFEDYTKGKQFLEGAFGTSAFHNMLMGKYSSFEKAMSIVSKTGFEILSCPISRDFCVFKDKNKTVLLDSLFEEVGVITDGTLVVNDWWYTPTMVDRLGSLGVKIKEN
jgi:hypothetical protein